MRRHPCMPCSGVFASVSALWQASMITLSTSVHFGYGPRGFVFSICSANTFISGSSANSLSISTSERGENFATLFAYGAEISFPQRYSINSKQASASAIFCDTKSFTSQTGCRYFVLRNGYNSPVLIRRIISECPHVPGSVYHHCTVAGGKLFAHVSL